MNQEDPSETIRFLYAWYEDENEFFRHGSSPGCPEKEAFWATFLLVALYRWQDDATQEVKLSELLRLYLTVYSRKFAPDMPIEEQPAFLTELQELFYYAREIAFRSDNADEVPHKLWSLLRSVADDANVLSSVGATGYILNMIVAAFEHPIPYRLVLDV